MGETIEREVLGAAKGGGDGEIRERQFEVAEQRKING
jgi:hypothetical protein